MGFLIKLNLLGAVWGASFLFMRIATPEFGPIALIEVRVLFASAVLLPIWWWRESDEQKRLVKTHWRSMLIVGATNSAIPFVLFAYSTLYITGGFSSILNATAPIWGAFVAWLWLGKTISRNAAIGLVFGVIGVVILVSGSMSTETNNPTLVLSAIAAGTFAAFLYGIAANYTAEKLQGVSSLSIATFSIFSASILLLPFAIPYYPSAEVSMASWLAVAAMGVFSTSLAYIWYFGLIENVGASALTVAFLVPVYATLWGAVFIAEPITATMVIGGAVVLLGLALVTGVIGRSKQHSS